MSLIGSLNTAVGGMNAQSAALSAISDNVANSQTVGFKGTNTTFADYVTGAGSTDTAPNMVMARSQYTNSLQGSVTQVSNPTSLAVSGAGFFAVQKPTGTSPAGATTFAPQTLYTRVGDFSTDNAGYLVNSTGYALDGWPAQNAAGTTFNTNAVGPIQISKAPSVPVPTSNVSLAANLPSSPTTDTVTTPYTSTVQVFDAGGNPQSLNLSWSQVATTPNTAISATNPAVPNQWNLTVTSGTSVTGPLKVTFGEVTNGGTTTGTPGTITSITQAATDPAGTVPAASAQTAGSGANVTLALAPSSGLGAQSITLNLGKFSTSSGITQFAATDYAVTSQTQDGSPQGSFSSVAIKATGDVVISYDNGSTKTVGRVPLVSFNNPNGLQQQDGQTFTATADSGSANAQAAGTGGVGTLVVGAEEASNVDIAAQFTQMIVAQRAYTANSKIITTANQLMQDTLNIVQG